MPASRWCRAPGFGAPGHMRLSFACSMQTLEKALERIARILVQRVVTEPA